MMTKKWMLQPVRRCCSRLLTRAERDRIIGELNEKDVINAMESWWEEVK